MGGGDSNRIWRSVCFRANLTPQIVPRYPDQQGQDGLVRRQTVEPIFEADFYNASGGFRTKMSAYDAVGNSWYALNWGMRLHRHYLFKRCVEPAEAGNDAYYCYDR